MGTQGVPWEKDYFVICDAIKKHKGRITHICKDPTINCCTTTFRTRMNLDPTLNQLLSDYRNNWVEDGLDKAEDVLMDLMDNVKEDGNAALKASMYFLNNLGKKRGFASPEEKAADRTLEIQNVERPYHEKTPSDSDPA